MSRGCSARQGTRQRQRGIALVAALFLVVVVAALGVFAVRIGVGQQHSVDLALLGSRALAAADSGLEWGAYRAIQSGTCSNATLNLSEAALQGFTVAVTCAMTTHTEAGTTVHIYIIDAFASAGTYGTPHYVSRRARARFTDAN